LVVLAIVSSIAIPTYRSYLLRSQRGEATATLLRIQTAQEKFFVQNNRYADDLSAPAPTGLGVPAISASGYYDLRIDILEEGAAYRAVATARAGGGQADDTHCGAFVVDHNGIKTATDQGGGDASTECWR
jgi:type IV pilus assembly protein PilE